METSNQESNGAKNTVPTAGGKNWGRRIAIGGLAIVLLGGAGIAAAMSSDFGGRMMGGFSGHGMGHMMHARMGGMGFGERRLDNMLEEIDATPEQSTKLKAIVEAARTDVMPLAEGFGETQEEIANLLGAATIDRAAAEKLRSERIAAIDTASRRVTTALLDAAEVLTPEQRTELVEHFKERGSHHRW